MNERRAYTKSEISALRDLGLMTEVFHHATLGVLNVTATRALIMSETYRRKMPRPLRCRWADLRTPDADLGDGPAVLKWLIGPCQQGADARDRGRVG